jgi:cell filamentation protein
LPGGYDLAHLQAFHREISGDLYPWAGEIRVVAIAKSDMFGWRGSEPIGAASPLSNSPLWVTPGQRRP